MNRKRGFVELKNKKLIGVEPLKFRIKSIFKRSLRGKCSKQPSTFSLEEVIYALANPHNSKSKPLIIEAEKLRSFLNRIMLEYVTKDGFITTCRRGNRVLYYREFRYIPKSNHVIKNRR